jgi:SAM-dependent methyltransferase
VELNQFPGGSCCCGAASPGALPILAGYSREALAALPADAVQNSFGCGNPVALAEIREGDTILDLGSGAGIDLLLAAKLAGPAGKVIGVDMTPAMIQRARANAAAAGLMNVEVREGIIEKLPIESSSIDLVLSNCVINLSPEKKRVFAELHRVLKAGGRFSISDIVAEPMPDWIRAEGLLYSACIAGAIPESAYLDGLRQAGLVDVAVRDRLIYDAAQLRALLDTETAGACCCGGAPLPKDQLQRVIEALAGKVSSIRVVGRKPGEVRDA